jgi:hypothetical protein
MSLNYFLIKFTAYFFWCLVGWGWLCKGVGSIFWRALGLGIFRLALGFLVGIPMFLMAWRVNGLIHNDFLAYVLVYVPTRVVEWFITYRIFGLEAKNTEGWIWILGGVVISCLADCPMIIRQGAFSMPLGRLVC